MNRKLLFAAAAMTLLTACNQDEIATDPAAGRVPVTLSYTMVDVAETRAATNLNQGTFASGESVTVRISNHAENDWTDYDFTTGNDGTMSPTSTVPYYPAGSQNIDIIAYYPATAGTSFTVATDQTTDAAYKASDLMVAYLPDRAKQTEPVNLGFLHEMAKLIVNVTAGSGVGKINSVSILNVKPTVTFDKKSTSTPVDESVATTSIAMSNGGAAVIPAQTIDGELLSIVTDKGTAVYRVTEKNFLPGKVYTLNLTVNLYAVGATNAIDNWNGDNCTSEEVLEVNPDVLEAVDLGGPNGIKWANKNVGASIESDYGTYFAWGETVGLTVLGSTTTPAPGNTKTTFEPINYTLCNFTTDKIIKYCLDEQYGTVDNKTVLDLSDDAANVKSGNGWRMPTTAEFEWLILKCTWTWTTRNGVAGMLVTSNETGYTSNSIFLPAAGHIDNTRFHDNSTIGYYWSSNVSSSSHYAFHLVIENNGYIYAQNSRYLGLPVRPVYDPHE